MSLKLFSEDYGREISKELLADINARAGLPSDANGTESTTGQAVVVRLLPLFIFQVLVSSFSSDDLSPGKRRFFMTV